jgi:hypothetical protein
VMIFFKSVVERLKVDPEDSAGIWSVSGWPTTTVGVTNLLQ